MLKSPLLVAIPIKPEVSSSTMELIRMHMSRALQLLCMAEQPQCTLSDMYDAVGLAWNSIEDADVLINSFEEAELGIVNGRKDKKTFQQLVGEVDRGSFEAQERSIIIASLEAHDWRLDGPQGVAHELGLHRNSLRYKMKRLGICRVQNKLRQAA